MLDAAKDAAVIEAKEECGITVEMKNLELFSISHCGSMIEWDLYYFIIREFMLGEQVGLGEDEFIIFDWYTQDQIIELVRA